MVDDGSLPNQTTLAATVKKNEEKYLVDRSARRTSPRRQQ